jgi:TRAP-type C4-dicarboxylate transport system substrate-binding protein
MPSGNDMRLVFATEYPEDALPGEALALLARLVNGAGGSGPTIEPHFESNQSLFATATAKKGSAVGGIVFGASLRQHAKEFELAAIPRGEREDACEEDVKRFRRMFGDCLYREGFRLLATVPMPPTGVWSSRQIDSVASLAGLRIRSYDGVSHEVFASIGCAATLLPFAGLRAALEAGELDAVLSSGDGAAGDLLASHFGYYLPVAYSTPLCFLVVRESSVQGLSTRGQRTLESAGRDVQIRYWTDRTDREAKNLRAIEDRGIRMSRSLPGDVMTLLEKKMELVRRRLIAEHALADILVPIA